MKSLLFIMALLTSIVSFSQTETIYWYFGNKAGLHFSNLPFPKKLNDGNINALAGCATISDKNGNLKLYTNGASIWKKDHLIISGGFGDQMTSQNSIIIKQPESDSLYYTITSSKNGVSYTLIDIENNQVLSSKKLIPKSTGKITGVHHLDGKSIWFTVIGGEKLDHFFTYKISNNGISKKPIKTFANISFIDENDSGYMKYSPNGKNLAVVNKNLNIELFDFNSTTGIISNGRNLSPRTPPPYENLHTYGIEFSQSSEFLYTTTVWVNEENSNDTTSFIVQFDLRNSNSTFIHREIINEKKTNIGALQLGLDGKIYRAVNNGSDFNSGGNYLDAILKPNLFGDACKYKEKVITFNDNIVHLGLPNFVTSYFRNRIISNNQCVSDTFEFDLDAYAPITSVTWDFGDGTTSSLPKPYHKYNTSGRYNVSATITINGNQVKLLKEIEVYSLPKLTPNLSLKQCDDNNDGKSLFNLKNIIPKISKDLSLTYKFYTSKNDAINEVKEIINVEDFYNQTNPQQIFIKAFSEKNCNTIESFLLETKYTVPIEITPIVVCDDSDQITHNNKGDFDLRKKRNEISSLLNLGKHDNISFYHTKEDALKSSNKLPIRHNSASTFIWVKIEKENECSGISPIELIVISPKINLEDIYTICINPKYHPPLVLTADLSNDKFEWADKNGRVLSRNNSFTLNKIGEFTLTVYKTINGLECLNSKQFTVKHPASPNIIKIDVNTESNIENTVYVSVNGNSSYEFSLDDINFTGNGSSHTFTNVPPGISTIYIRDIKNCENSITASASIIGYPKFLTPNSDNNNDSWYVYGVNSSFFKEIDIKIFNRFGKIVHTINEKNAELGWDGTYNGKILPSNEYWFHAKLKDLNNNIIDKKGHFSLMRK